MTAKPTMQEGSPAAQGGLPEEPSSYNQIGIEMVQCSNTFDGKPSGHWVKASDYDALSAAAKRLEVERDELHMVMKFLVDTVHKAKEKSRGR